MGDAPLTLADLAAAEATLLAASPRERPTTALHAPWLMRAVVAETIRYTPADARRRTSTPEWRRALLDRMHAPGWAAPEDLP